MNKEQEKLLTFMRSHPGGVSFFFIRYGLCIKYPRETIKSLVYLGYTIKLLKNAQEPSTWILVPEKKKKSVKTKPVRPQRYYIFNNQNNTAREVTREEWERNQQIQTSFL